MPVDMPVTNRENSNAPSELASLENIKARLKSACLRARRGPDEVWLVGAAKTVPAVRLIPFLKNGLQHVGENYIQEGIVKKRDAQDVKNVSWHFIGALQSNKAREAVEHFDYIHSIDRPSLITAVNKAAAQINKIQNVLLQVNLGDEHSKAGCAPEDALSLASSIRQHSNLNLCGLMCLPPYHEESEAMRPYFVSLKDLRDEIARVNGQKLPHLSMGMSNDFEIAIEEGATMVRLGTSLFGER